jgi:hypothetical protein
LIHHLITNFNKMKNENNKQILLLSLGSILLGGTTLFNRYIMRLPENVIDVLKISGIILIFYNVFVMFKKGRSNNTAN